MGCVIERKTKTLTEEEEEREVEARRKLLLFSFLLGSPLKKFIIITTGSLLLLELTREVFSSSFGFNNLALS